MKTFFRTPWRLLFILGGLLVIAGGPMHPTGTMAEMLAHPDWFMSHALMSLAFVSWTFAWWMLARSGIGNHWHKIAFWATLIQMIEFWFHTFAYVDAEAFAAGTAAPIATIHLTIVPWVGAAYGAAIMVVIWKTQRSDAPGPGTLAFGWVGMLGALGHGLANLLVAGFRLEAFRVLFPAIALLALWHVFAAIWPGRRAV